MTETHWLITRHNPDTGDAAGEVCQCDIGRNHTADGKALDPA